MMAKVDKMDGFNYNALELKITLFWTSCWTGLGLELKKRRFLMMGECSRLI